MKPIFDKKWHGIPLDCIADLKDDRLPGNDFYSKFYVEFFKKYRSWEGLDSDWVDHKLNIARFIRTRIPDGGRTLSIGCGIGIIEKYLLESGTNGLEIQEVTDVALRWIKPLFATEAVHVGIFPECLNSSEKFGYIYLAVVDYCFNQQEWIDTLKAVRERLSDSGRCLVIAPTIRLGGETWSETYLNLKLKVKQLLFYLGLYDFGQLMGWGRTIDEFRQAMEQVGFEVFEEGFISDALVAKTYWIEGTHLWASGP